MSDPDHRRQQHSSFPGPFVYTLVVGGLLASPLWLIPQYLLARRMRQLSKHLTKLHSSINHLDSHLLGIRSDAAARHDALCKQATTLSSQHHSLAADHLLTRRSLEELMHRVECLHDALDAKETRYAPPFLNLQVIRLVRLQYSTTLSATNVHHSSRSCTIYAAYTIDARFSSKPKQWRWSCATYANFGTGSLPESKWGATIRIMLSYRRPDSYSCILWSRIMYPPCHVLQINEIMFVDNVDASLDTSCSPVSAALSCLVLMTANDYF